MVQPEFLKTRTITTQRRACHVPLHNACARPITADLICLQYKKIVKSFVRENKFHTYPTRETLPAEKRASKFHNHGETPSYQTFTDASMKKFVLKSYGSSLKEWTRKLFFVLRLGPSVTIILVNLSAVVGKIVQTT